MILSVKKHSVSVNLHLKINHNQNIPRYSTTYLQKSYLREGRHGFFRMISRGRNDFIPSQKRFGDIAKTAKRTKK